MQRDQEHCGPRNSVSGAMIPAANKPKQTIDGMEIVTVGRIGDARATDHDGRGMRAGDPMTRQPVMQAMVLDAAGRPLRLASAQTAGARRGSVARVRACGVCRTDLHLVDGELPEPKLPIIPGHEIVADVVARGAGVTELRPGTRVGVPWLGWSCGRCRWCTSGRENLCAEARFTGYQRDGGYAEYAIADARFCFELPATYGDLEAAPLLCAGLIGYRAYRSVGNTREWVSTVSGAAAHLIAQVAAAQGRKVLAFTRPGDREGQAFARELARGVGGRQRRAVTRAARRRAALCARRCAGSGRACGGRARGNGRLRGDPHERPAVVSLSPAVGRAQRAVGSQPHP